MKYLSIIGSTGSIGTQTLDVVSQHPDQFKVVALVAHHNLSLIHIYLSTARSYGWFLYGSHETLIII